MKPNTIRIIDGWLGRPICLLLTLLRTLLSALGLTRKDPVEIRKILFLKWIEQGSTVLAGGALRQATRKVGKNNVYFCVFDENRPVLDLLNIVPSKNVYPIRHTNLILFFCDTLTALFRIRRAGIDVVLDLEFYSRASAIFAFLSGARCRVGLHRFTSEAPYRGDLMTHRVQYNPYLHTADAYRLLVDALERNPVETPLIKTSPTRADGAPPAFSPSDEERKRVKGMLADILPVDHCGPIVLLNPNAGDLLPLRKWEGDRFVQLGERILSTLDDAVVLFTGAKSEQEETESLCKAILSKRAVSLAGKTTLRELMALYTLSQALVTNDSGPAHFASMTDIHIIVLFGPESPHLYQPLGKNIHVVWSEIACSPCVNVANHRFSPCTDNVCMKQISVEQVFGEVKRCLEG